MAGRAARIDTDQFPVAQTVGSVRSASLANQVICDETAYKDE